MQKVLIVILTILLHLNVNSQSLISSYPFNGTAVDTAGINNGLLLGTQPTSNRFNFTNSALYFNGVDDKVALPASIFNSLSEFSLSMWFYADGIQSGMSDLLQFDLSVIQGQPPHTLFIRYDNINNEFIVRMRIAAIANVSITTSLPTLNTWHHLVLVHTQGGLLLYIDGQLVGTPQTITGSFGTSLTGHLCYVGNWADNGSGFLGKIDDILLYDYGMTPVQVFVLYNTSIAVGLNEIPENTNTKYNNNLYDITGKRLNNSEYRNGTIIKNNHIYIKY